MKWPMRILIIGVLIAAVVFPIFMKKKDGTPVMKLEDWIPAPPAGITSEAKVAYKWKDAQGRTVYSDQKPPNQSWETLELDPNANVMQGIPKPKGTSAEESPSMVPGLTANPLNAIQQAKDARAAMENRTPPP